MGFSSLQSHIFFLIFLNSPHQVTAASGAQEGGTVEPEGVSFTRGALILPPHLLDYGEYYFHLEVWNLESVYGSFHFHSF